MGAFLAWALRAIGPEAREAIPALHAALTNQDPRLRVEVAWAIWSVAKETNLVVEICTNAFATSRGDILAAWVLEDLGPVSAGTAPLILQVLRDQSRSERLRSTAALTLGRMGLQTGEIKGALVAGTEDVKPLVRIGCAVALWQLDNKYAPIATLTIIDGLIKLDKSYGEASEDFVQFAENHKLDTKASVPTLTELLKSESPIIRQAASEALKKIGAKQITGAEGR